MDELALRNLLNSLEASRSSLHFLLHCFTWAVVVGLGLDLIVIIKEFWDDWKEFRYGQIHPHEIHLPKRPSVGLLVFGLLGTALIVIGVAGELYVDVQAGKIETRIREANDKLLGLIIQEAGDAKTSARDAANAAAHAKDQSDKAVASASKAMAIASSARREADSFEKDIKSAKTLAADAESHLAEALKEATNAQAELNRLRSPRSLTNVSALISTLQRFKGTKF